MSSSAAIASPHLRKNYKKLESRVHEFAATPVLLSLADRRLRTQSKSSTSTVLGSEFHTSLPAALALYRQIVSTIHRMGLAVQQQQHHHHQQYPPTPPPGFPISSTSSSNIPSPTPPPGAGETAADAQQQKQQQQAMGLQNLPFGILPSDAPMVAQGKLLEAWAAFLGGEKRRMARLQAQAQQHATSEIAKQVAAKHNVGSPGGERKSSPLYRREDDKRNHLAHSSDSQPSSSSSAAVAAAAAATLTTSVNTSNDKPMTEEERQKEKLDGAVAADDQQILLCEVAIPGLDYPAVVLRAIENEESERNPKAELELYVNHYEALLKRGEASSQGTIRDLETSVFVTLTQSLLSLVQLAVPRVAPRGLHGSGGGFGAKGRAESMRRRPGSANTGGGDSGSASAVGSRTATPVGQMMTAMQQQQQQQQQQYGEGQHVPQQIVPAGYRPSSGHGAIWKQGGGGGSSRPGSAASSLQTTAQQQQQQQHQQQLLSSAAGGGRVASAGLGTNTPIPAPPAQQQGQQQPAGGAAAAAAYSATQQQQHHSRDQAVLQEIQRREAEIEQHGVPSGATMTVARAVCRPNSAVHLYAKRSYPRSMNRFMSATARCAHDRVVQDREAQDLAEAEANSQLTDEQIVQMQLDQMQMASRTEKPPLLGSKSPPRSSSPSCSPKRPSTARLAQNRPIEFQSHRTHLRPPQGRADVASEWKTSNAAATEAVVGVGPAAKAVAPSAGAQNWTFGHKSNASPKVDTRRPRHGKVLQTERIAARMQGSAEHPTRHDGVTAATSNTGGAHAGGPSHSARTVQHAASVPTSWNPHQEQGWVLAPGSP